MAAFYGNIQDTGRNYFQFDRIFASRKDMDEACAAGIDGVFAGRFVLVKYDPEKNTFFDWNILIGYKKDGDNHIYSGKSIVNNQIIFSGEYYFASSFTRVTGEPVAEDWNTYFIKINDIEYIHLPNENYFSSDAEYYQVINSNHETYDYELLISPGRKIAVYTYDANDNLTDIQCYVPDANASTHLEAITQWLPYADNLSNLDSNYVINFKKDKETYGLSNTFDPRGYDATVWEKIFENGRGKFIKVANLNGMMPQLDLITDPPSEQPQAPYFDALSSDGYYRLHMPSNWGFQIKPAIETEQGSNSYILSDQIVSYQNNDGLISKPAEIYLNLSGNPYATGQDQLNYHRNAQHYDNSKNEIIYSFDGQSGAIYNGTTANDIIQMSIHVPAIGNVIDEGYDLIYGSNELNENNEKIRPRDIQWYSGDEELLKNQGNSNLGGKTYELNTIAGSLNTIHNRLGQIIIKLPTRPEASTVSQYSSDYIYFIEDENKYYRVGQGYSYEELTNSEDYYLFEPINLTNDTYITDTFYYKDEENHYQISTGYNNSETYYKKSVKEEMYEEITLIGYYPEMYFLKRGSDYIRDNSEQPSAPNQQYYAISNPQSIAGSSFSSQYAANLFHYKDENDNYIMDINDIPLINRTYYLISSQQAHTNVIIYQKNKFYYQTNEGNYLLCTYNTLNEVTNANITNLYWLEFDETQDIITSYVDENNITQTIIGHPLKENGAHRISTRGMIDVANTNDLYVNYNGDYIAFKNLDTYIISSDSTPFFAIARNYSIITNIEEQTNLFVNGKYYYINNEGSYILSYSGLNRNITYYLLDNAVNELEYPFYLPGIYYWESSNNFFEIDNYIRMVVNRTYYIKHKLFVIADYTGRCPYGYEWSNYALYVPASVTLGKRTEVLQFIEIKNFVDGGIGSINGHLLQLEKSLELANADTRNLNTVQGSLNSLQDALYKLKDFVPQRIIIVNDFGQLTSSSIQYNKLLDIMSKYNQIMNL